MSVLKDLVKANRALGKANPTASRVKASDGDLANVTSLLSEAIVDCDSFISDYQSKIDAYHTVMDGIVSAKAQLDKGDLKGAYKTLEKTEKLKSSVVGVSQARRELSFLV